MHKTTTASALLEVITWTANGGKGAFVARTSTKCPAHRCLSINWTCNSFGNIHCRLHRFRVCKITSKVHCSYYYLPQKSTFSTVDRGFGLEKKWVNK